MGWEAYDLAMRRVEIVVVAAGVWFAACQPANITSTLPSPRAGMRLTTEVVARQLSRHAQHIDVPFRLVERGVNGTGILLAFLQRMETYGVGYVSDVSYALQLTHNGTTIECVSKILVDDGSRAIAEATGEATSEATSAAPGEGDGEVEYTTTVKPWRPRATDAWVVDRDMVCKQHAQQVATHEPRYENDYNAEIGRAIAPGGIPIETTTIVHYDECAYQPNRHLVHRYEHFVAARFSPPDLDVIKRSYADLPLVPEPPLCHEIRLPPGQALRHHIDATIHFPATIVPTREHETLLVEPVKSVSGD